MDWTYRLSPLVERIVNWVSLGTNPEESRKDQYHLVPLTPTAEADYGEDADDIQLEEGKEREEGVVSVRSEKRLLIKLGTCVELLLGLSCNMRQFCHRIQRPWSYVFKAPLQNLPGFVSCLVDLVILPLAMLLYLSAYLDRGNMGNARLLGLEAAVLDGSDTKCELCS